MLKFKIRPLLQGNVKFREGRKWKRRYCLLSLSPNTNDGMHLYITKNFDEFAVYRNQGYIVDGCQPLPHANECRPDFCQRLHTWCHGSGVQNETVMGNSIASATAAAQAASAGLSVAHSVATSLGSGAPTPLDEITGFESGLHLDKESQVVILIGCNAVHAISLSSLPEMFTWANTMSKVVTDDHFRVTLSQTADGSKLPQGLQASLHVQHWRICLIGEPTAGCKFLCAWPLNTIGRAYMLTTSASTAPGAGQSASTSKNVFQLEATADAGKGRGSHTFELAANCNLPYLTSAIDRLMALRWPQSSVPVSKTSLTSGNSGCGSLCCTTAGHCHQHQYHCHEVSTARSLQPSHHHHHHNQPWSMTENTGSLKNYTNCHGMVVGGCSIGACTGGIGSSCSPISSSFSPSEDANSCSTGSIGAMQHAGACSYHLPTPQRQIVRPADPTSAHLTQEATGSTGNIGFLSDGDGNLAMVAAVDASVNASPASSRKSVVSTGDQHHPLLLTDETHQCLPPFLHQRRPMLPFDHLLLNDPSANQRPFKISVTPTSGGEVTDSYHLTFSLTEAAQKQQQQQQEQYQPRSRTNALTTANSGSSIAASPTSPASSYPLDDCGFKSVDPTATATVMLTASSYDRQVVGSVPPRRGISDYANFSAMLSASKTSDYSSNDQQRGWPIIADSRHHHPLVHHSSLDPALNCGDSSWTPVIVDRLPPASPICRHPPGDSSERKSSPQLASVDEGIGLDYPTSSYAGASSDGHRLALAVPNSATSATALSCHRDEFNSLQTVIACRQAHRQSAPLRLQSKSCDDLRLQQSGGREHELATIPLPPSHQSLSAVSGSQHPTKVSLHSGMTCSCYHPVAIQVPPGDIGQFHLPCPTLPRVPNLGYRCGEADLTDVRILLADRCKVARGPLGHRVPPLRQLRRVRSIDELFLSRTDCWLVWPRYRHRRATADREDLAIREEDSHGQPHLLLVDLPRLSRQRAWSRSKLDNHHHYCHRHPDMVSNQLLSLTNAGTLSSSDSCLSHCRWTVPNTEKANVRHVLSLLTLPPSHSLHWFSHKSDEAVVSERLAEVEQRLVRTSDRGWDRWLRSLLTRLTTDGKSGEGVAKKGEFEARTARVEPHTGVEIDASDYTGDSLGRVDPVTTTAAAGINSNSKTMASPSSLAGTAHPADPNQLFWLSCRSEALPLYSAGGQTKVEQAVTPLQAAYCKVASLVQPPWSNQTSSQNLDSVWSVLGDSSHRRHQDRSQLPGLAGTPQSPSHQRKYPPGVKLPASYVNVAMVGSGVCDTPSLASGAAQLPETRHKQTWLQQSNLPNLQSQLAAAAALTDAPNSSLPVDAGWPHACQLQQQEMACCDLHNGGSENDARCPRTVTAPLMCATSNEAMQIADSGLIRSHQILHAPHLLSVGDLPEEVRDPSRNYAVVDLRPSPASSVNTAFSQHRCHYQHHLHSHRTATLDDLKWHDSSAAGIFGSKTNSAGDGVTLTPGDAMSTDAFPLATPSSSLPGVVSSTAIVRPSSLSVRQGLGGTRRRHSHSLSLTVDCGFPGLEPGLHNRLGAGGNTMTLDRSVHHQPALPSHHHHHQQQQQQQQQQLNYVHVFATTCSNRIQSTVADSLTRLPASSQDANSTTKAGPPPTTSSTISIRQTNTTGVANSFGSTGSSGNGSRSMTSSATSSSGEGAASGLAMGAGGGATVDTGFTSSCSPLQTAGLLSQLPVDDGHVAYTEIDFARTLALGELSDDMNNQQQQSLHSTHAGGLGSRTSSSGVATRWSVGRITSATTSSACSANANATTVLSMSSVGGRPSSSTANVNSVRKTLSQSIRSIRRSTTAGHRRKSGSLLG